MTPDGARPWHTPPGSADQTEPVGAHEPRGREHEATLVAELERRVEALEDNWQRALADAANAHKRLARDLAHARVEERYRLASKWLPLIDHLDLALSHARDESDPVVVGVRAVREEAVAVLSGLGYPRRDVVRGARFNPSRHEAVATVPSAEVAEGTVVDVVRPGYGDGERQLRRAAVVVATRPE